MQIQHDDVGALVEGKLRAYLAVGGLEDIVTGVLRDVPDDIAESLLVIDDEHAFVARGCGAR